MGLYPSNVGGVNAILNCPDACATSVIVGAVGISPGGCTVNTSVSAPLPKELTAASLN